MLERTNELEWLTWREVEEYLRHDRRIAFVLGATEQHGHLSIGNDTLNALDLARQATKAEGVILAPPIYFGVSMILSAFPGTLYLTAETFVNVIRDLVRSAYQNGFRRLLFINGHGPHYLLIPFLGELMNELDDLVCDFYTWASEPEIVHLQEKIRPRGMTHANWGENWPASRPALYKVTDEEPWWDYERDVLLYSPEELRANIPSGSFGGPQEIPENELQPMIDLAVELARARLRRLGK